MNFIDVEDTDFDSQIKNNDLVIVKYYADWCGNCRLIAPKYKKMAKNEVYSKVTFLNVDAEHNPQARKAVGVQNLPFFATFKQGLLVEATETSKVDKVEDMLESLIK